MRPIYYSEAVQESAAAPNSMFHCRCRKATRAFAIAAVQTARTREADLPEP